MAAYWAFLARGVGDLSSTNTLEQYCPSFWRNCGYSALFFVSLFLLFMPVVTFLWPKWVR